MGRADCASQGAPRALSTWGLTYVDETRRKFGTQPRPTRPGWIPFAGDYSAGRRRLGGVQRLGARRLRRAKLSHAVSRADPASRTAAAGAHDGRAGASALARAGLCPVR